MTTSPRLSSKAAHVLSVLTLASLCACAPASSGDTGFEDPTAPVSSSEPSPSPAPPETATSDPPAAEPPPAAPPEKAITAIPLYTASGTFVAARDGYQADIAKAVDPRYYEWVPIDYPATLFPLNASINQGVANLVAQIQSRPGKFALVGFSQGGAIVSRVYEELRHGSLQSRRQDLIAGVALGNPWREAGHTIPGGMDPGGHGLMSQRLSATEDLWWEFCAPGDLACSVGDDPVGRDYTAVADIVMFRWPGQGDPVQLVLSLLTNPLLALQQPLAALQQIGALPAAVQGVLAWAIPGAGNGAHGAYPILKPIPGDPRTSIEIAVDYLDQAAVAAAQ